MPKTVALTGASGFVGRYVARELISRGYAVRALVRSRDKARQVLSGVQLVTGDVFDAGKTDELLDGCAACINLLGIIREARGEQGQRPQTFQRIHTDATRLLVAKCAEKKVTRYIQMSAINATDAGSTDYQRTKFEAEMIVRLSDLHWTIFRPSMIHGPDGEFVQMVKGWATGHAAPFIFIPYFTRGVEDKRVPLGPIHDIDPKIAPVFVGDVARAFVSAIDNPTTHGEVYNLVGAETLSWPTMLGFMRDNISGAHEGHPVFGVPSYIAAHAAHAAALLGMGGLLPFDEGMARMGGMDATASLTKFREHFKMEPAPFKASFKNYAAQV